MRTKGYKCYNIKCGACVGKTLCGLSGDEALTCDSRMVYQKTNADRIRAMSDEELAEFLTETMCEWANKTATERKLIEYTWLKKLRQPAKEDA